MAFESMALRFRVNGTSLSSQWHFSFESSGDSRSENRTSRPVHGVCRSVESTQQISSTHPADRWRARADQLTAKTGWKCAQADLWNAPD